MQALADLQQIVVGLSAQLGLAPVASMLPSFPHDAIGFPIALSPSPVAVAKAQGEGGNWIWWLGMEGGAAGGRGDTSTGQTLAELPLPRVASDFGRATGDADGSCRPWKSSRGWSPLAS
ncbi:hypothetical protein GUJ93_ZPchr0007g5793 [Zizania palustris]|uniref:Uncharacterized protein n=1 Tax=Zizania palustris TaxID=103762 RepID=A0A8J5TDX5_ZIZPA|nr:hypothetical protein GUJ93_ZPchr0007g5793 [Zizania palustris]